MTVIRRHHAVNLEQASEDSPILSQLSALVRESSAHLDSISPLLPASLKPAVKCGPLEGETWCLLADNAAAAAKLRQLGPKILEHFAKTGAKVKTIRVRILGGA